MGIEFRCLSSCIAAMALTTAATLAPQIAVAQDTLRVGKSVGAVFTYVPLDVGIRQGIFEKAGLKVEIVTFSGPARQMQAMIGNSIEIGMGSGAGFAQLAKGAPITAVSAVVNTMANVAVIVGYNSPIKTIDDLKGRKIGITTAGSLTDWMVRELNRNKGWDKEPAIPVAIGGSPAGNLAAIKVGAVDAFINDIGVAFQGEVSQQLRLLAPVSVFARNFIREVALVPNTVLKDNPELVRRYNKAWFDSVAFAKANRAETIRVSSDVQKIGLVEAGRVYDAAIAMFSDDGRFDPGGLDTLRSSLVEMGLLSEGVDLSKSYSEAYLPSKKN